MKHFFFIIMLLLNFSTFFAQKNNHDCMQGVWEAETICVKNPPIYCETKFVLIHEDEIFSFHFSKEYHWKYVKGGAWKLFGVKEYGEGKMWVEKYQFLLIKTIYHYDELTNVFICEEVEDVNSNGLALFRYDRSELDLRGDRISSYRPSYRLNIKKCSNDSIRYCFHDSSREIDLKRIDKDSLPSYLSDGIFNYSLTSQRDYFHEFFGKTVGVIKESDADKDTTSKKGRIRITDENESSYYVKPLGSSNVKEGWVNKKDVKLLREMIGK